MDKQIVVYTFNGILDIKRNKVLIYAKTWMNFKSTMLGEISQTQTVTYHLVPFM